MDDKLLRIEITRTLDSDNDTARLVYVPFYRPYELYGKVSIDYKGITFDGIVVQIDESTESTIYTLAAPSVLLTRGECDIALEDELDVVDAVRSIVPDEFDVQYDGDETYSNADSRGQIIMDVIKDIATSVGSDVYVDGWTIVFGERATPEGREITLSPDDVEFSERKSVGGSDFFTRVKGYYFGDEDAGEYTVEIYSGASYSTVDVISSEEEDVDSFDALKKLVRKRADEIRSSAFSRTFRLLRLVDIKPFDVLLLEGKRYKVTEVRYVFSADGFEEEVTAYETS